VADPLKRRDEEMAALEEVFRYAERYLGALAESPVLPGGATHLGTLLPEGGDGAVAALTELIASAGTATRSSGPRFFHFVTGGTTPAALGADWLTSLLDQNSFSWISSPLGSELEDVAIRWLLELFDLPESWGGVLTTGATMANFVGLGAARRWWAQEHGVDVDEQGFAGLPAVPVLSTPYIHASALKALTMLGIGRGSVQIAEADELARSLEALGGAPAIMIGNAGEVNAGYFDPISPLADLAEEHGAWFHVDGAFGLFARLSPETFELSAGVERARSVIADGHKWLNVPYDCGFAFVRDRSALPKTFGLAAAYLPDDERPNYGYSSPEASRRARALAVWATLRAYGRAGYREMVERHLALAQRLGRRVEAEAQLELLAPVGLNIVCFRFRPPGFDEPALDLLNSALGEDILADSRVFVGTTRYDNKVAFRPAIVNWRTTERDVDLLVDVVLELGARRAAAVD